MAFFDTNARRTTLDSSEAAQYLYSAHQLPSRDTHGHHFAVDSALLLPTSYNPSPTTSRSPTGPPSNVGMIQLGRRRGFTRFFNSVKGFGFVIDSSPAELNGSDVFVHFTQIASHRGVRRDLAEGEEVEYDLLLGPKGYQAANVTGPGGRKVIGSLQSRTAAAAAAARATPSHWPGDYALGAQYLAASAAAAGSPLWNMSSASQQSLVSAGRVAPLVASSQAQQLYGTPAAAAAAPPAKFDLAKSALFSNGRSEDAMSWSMLDRASRETARFAQGELLNTASPPRFTFAPFNSPPSTQSLALAADPRA